MPITGSSARIASPIPQVAPGISFLTSPGTVDGVAAGNIPDDWHGGIAWTPEGCNPSHVWEWFDDYCDTNEDGVIDQGPFSGDDVVNPVEFRLVDPGGGKCAPQGVSESEAYPFTIYMPNDCDVRARSSALEDEQAQRTKRSLDARIGLQLAGRLHRGSPHPSDPSPSLQGSATDLTVETAVASGIPQSLCPHAAVGALLRAREVNGTGFGVLHVPSVAVPILLRDRLIVQAGSGYRTVNNLPVVTGGYPSTGPADTFGTGGIFEASGLPAGVVYFYMSSGVEYALGEPGSGGQSTEHADGDMGRIFDLLRQNRDERVFEIPALVRVDPCQMFAQAVAIGCDCTN